jgi:hypothetical protein
MSSIQAHTKKTSLSHAEVFLKKMVAFQGEQSNVA